MRFAVFTWFRVSQVLSIDSNHTHCAQHSSIISLSYNLEFQLFSFSQLNARLVPLELLRGGDPLASGLIGQPLVVELPHHNHILVPRLGAVLLGGHHVAVQRHDRLAVPAVCRVFFELLTDSELKLNTLDSGLGDHRRCLPPRRWSSPAWRLEQPSSG